MDTAETLNLELETLRNKVTEYARNGGSVTKLNSGLCGLVNGNVWNGAQKKLRKEKVDKAQQKHAKAYMKWTAEDEKLLEDLLPSTSVEDIATQLQRSHVAIRKKLLKKGLITYENGVYSK